jgi:hypothetical protein
MVCKHKHCCIIGILTIIHRSQLLQRHRKVELDLTNNIYTDIWALGTKDMNAVDNGFDISDNNTEILIANWPVKAFL